MDHAPAETLICAALRGDPVDWPDARDTALIGSVLARCNYHGVGPLLHERLRTSNWPQVLQQQLHQDAIDQARWELRHQQVLARTLAALAAIAIEPVLFKGTALAHSLYSNPVLRTRSDTDLIIPPADLARTDALLLGMGFRREMGVSGEFISYQASYTCDADDGQRHTLDLHWRINNSQLLARLFTHSELRQQAQGLPKLGPHAMGASPVHALLLACMHRATHEQNPFYSEGVAHYGGDRLIWLYDIHLLAATFTPAQWDEFARLADSKGLRTVCLQGMEKTSARFHTVYPDGMLAELARDGLSEPVARYLAGSRLRQQWMDFRAIGGSRGKLRFLRELVFPPATYMRQKYSGTGPALLPWLYIRRALGGIAKKLLPDKARH